jgi:uncharacterized membrane protein YfcA
MPESSTLLFISIGLAAGILSGIFGIGGGVVIVPALIYLGGFTQHRTTGTSLAVLLPPIGIGAMWEYYRHDNVNVRAAIITPQPYLLVAGSALSSPIECQAPSGWPSVFSWYRSASTSCLERSDVSIGSLDVHNTAELVLDAVRRGVIS